MYIDSAFVPLHYTSQSMIPNCGTNSSLSQSHELERLQQRVNRGFRYDNESIGNHEYVGSTVQGSDHGYAMRRFLLETETVAADSRPPSSTSSFDDPFQDPYRFLTSSWVPPSKSELEIPRVQWSAAEDVESRPIRVAIPVAQIGLIASESGRRALVQYGYEKADANELELKEGE